MNMKYDSLQTMFISYVYYDLADIGFDIFSFLSVLFALSWKDKIKNMVRA